MKGKRHPRMVEIIGIYPGGYSYMGNGDDEALLPHNTAEAELLYCGVGGIKQKMTARYYKKWYRDYPDYLEGVLSQ